MSQHKFIKRLRKDSAYILIMLVVGFFRILPRKAALMIGSFLGKIAPYLVPRERRLAEEHLTIAFGNEKSEQEIRRLSKDIFRFMALNFIDTVRLKTMAAEEIERICIVHNFEFLKEAHDNGKGIIGLSGHVGCWEMLGVWMTTIGIKSYPIARKLYDPRLERLLLDSREHRGITVISRGGNMREILRAFKKGHLVGMLIDQDTDIKGIFVDFFGHPAHTASAPALLSLRYGVPIVPLFIYRDNKHNHHICVGEPLSIEPTGDMDHDIELLTAAASKVTENFIREHPEQWVWFHRRWKTKPAQTTK